jgi:hypothetical protein
MIAALICAISIAALLQFFVSYCRSLLASSRKIELSGRVRELTGVAHGGFAPDDFYRLLQLLRLCPESSDDRTEIRAVGTYYGMLNLAGRVVQTAMPHAAAWTESERRNCSYFAAVALDRRISSSRDLFSQQLSDRL